MNRLFIILGIFILVIPLVIVISMRKGSREILTFEPGLISTDLVEYSPTFSRSGQEMYFARSAQPWASGMMTSSIYYSRKVRGTWSLPELVAFSGEFDDSGPHLTNDGSTLYFISKRPQGKGMLSSDIWRVVKDDSGHWGDPERLENPINSEGREYSPITDGKGNLYFASDRSGGFGQGDIYLSLLENGKFNTPVNMGPVINSEKGEWNLEINHDGNLMIFEASQRPDNVSPYGDLYISFKEKGLWSVPQNISELNTSGSELYPFLTYDEKTLFFTSSDSLKSVDTNIYHTQFRSLYKTYKERAIFNE